jgi:hypothetical protein
MNNANIGKLFAALSRSPTFQKELQKGTTTSADTIVEEMKKNVDFMEEMMTLVPDVTIIEEKMRVMISQKNKKMEKENNMKKDKENQEMNGETEKDKSTPFQGEAVRASIVSRRYQPLDPEKTTWLPGTNIFLENQNPSSIRMCFFIGDDEYETFY